ncbi:uncharacterized protein [Aristolochia californica]|uniref:uncharacterized protein n=1 Tax=Aristolochia californica TaxID=171875 RepID=UPI0035E12081
MTGGGPVVSARQTSKPSQTPPKGSAYSSPSLTSSSTSLVTSISSPGTRSPSTTGYTSSSHQLALLPDPSSVAGKPGNDVTWTPSMDECFINLLKYQTPGRKFSPQSGHAGFTEGVWKAMAESVSRKFSVPCCINDLKDRYHTLKTRYDRIKAILDRSGLSLDEARIIANPVFLEAYRDLNLMFAPEYLVDQQKSIVTVDNTEHPSQSDQRGQAHSGKRPLDDSLNQTRPAKRQITGADSAVDGNYSLQTEVTGEKKHGDEGLGLSGKWIAALREVSKLEEEFFRGCDILENENRAKIFLALNASERWKWLQRKLRSKM